MPVRVIEKSSAGELEESINEFLEKEVKTNGFTITIDKLKFQYSVSSHSCSEGENNCIGGHKIFSVLISWN